MLFRKLNDDLIKLKILFHFFLVFLFKMVIGIPLIFKDKLCSTNYIKLNLYVMMSRKVLRVRQLY